MPKERAIVVDDANVAYIEQTQESGLQRPV